MRSCALFAGTLALLGCGGGGAKYKIDDVSLAQVPIADKQPIFAAENEIAVARSEAQKARADIDAASSDGAIADNEFEQARLETRKVKLERDAASRSQDQNRLAAVEQRQKIADAGERAAGAKVGALKQKRKWHEAQLDAAEAHVAAAQAKVELEKARLAVAKGIKPTPDFKIDTYTMEYNKQDQGWDEGKRRADKRRAEAEAANQTWERAKAAHAALVTPPAVTSPGPAAPATPPAK